MPSLKKRPREGDGQNSASEDYTKLRKKRSKQDNELFRALLSPLDTQSVGRSVVETLVKMLKRSLFMHKSRLREIYSVVSEDNAENERLKSICRLFESLSRPPAVLSFLSDMLLLFLKPEEAIEMNCFEAYRCRMQALEILAKAQQYQRIIKCKTLSKSCLKPLHESDAPDNIDTNAIRESFHSWLGGDARLYDFILPLFPDLSIDASNVSVNDPEIIRGDFVQEQESDEFEVINWTDACENDLSSRQCLCSCHQNNSANGIAVGHCGLCAIKFFGEHAYIWRGNRLVRALIEYSDSDGDEMPLDVMEDEPSTISPSKIFPSGTAVSDKDSEWNRVFQAVDSLEYESGEMELSPNLHATTPRSSSTTPRKLWPNVDSNQDVLKQAFMETFGRNLWGKGYSPLKRPGQSFGLGGPNEESNSTSYVFVRGFDGANTMLANAVVDSNSIATTSYGGNCFDSLENPTSSHGERTLEIMTLIPKDKTPIKASTSIVATIEEAEEADETEQEEESWTEEEDRYLLEQFKTHGNIYEAGTAAMAKLRKSRHTIRDRLKLLLELLNETM